MIPGPAPEENAPDRSGVAPSPKRVQLGGGANQAGARAYNDRLILSLIRRAGALPKAELSRLTGLSAQTLTMIAKRLERDDLIRAEKPVRGRVGQPSTPYSLNPEAVFSFGAKIGRRSIDLMLCDFTGAARMRAEARYDWPDPDVTAPFLRRESARMATALGPARAARIIGAGVATPFRIWDWAEEVGAPRGALDRWRETDIEVMVAEAIGVPALLCNDGAAASAAELVAADGAQHLGFLRVFVGWFIGGGLALGGALFPGGCSAGAIGSMPVRGPDGPVQLIGPASLAALEAAQRASGRIAARDAIDWEDGTELNAWLARAGDAIAQVAASTVAVVDIEAVYLDGAFPPTIRDALTDRVRAAYAALDTRGLSDIDILAGRCGADARARGAAILPILAEFSRDREVLLKTVRAAE